MTASRGRAAAPSVAPGRLSGVEDLDRVLTERLELRRPAAVRPVDAHRPVPERALALLVRS